MKKVLITIKRKGKLSFFPDQNLHTNYHKKLHSFTFHKKKKKKLEKTERNEKQQKKEENKGTSANNFHTKKVISKSFPINSVSSGPVS